VQKLQEEILKLVHQKEKEKVTEKHVVDLLDIVMENIVVTFIKNVKLENSLHTDFQENVGMIKFIKNGNV